MPVISTFKGCWEDWKVYVENLAECLQHLINHNFHFLLSFKSCFFHNHLFWFCISLWSKIRPGFLNSSRTGISGQVVLCCGGAVLCTGRCLQHPWLLPPHTHQEHQLWRPQKCLWTLPSVPERTNCPWLRITASYRELLQAGAVVLSAHELWLKLNSTVVSEK